MGQPGFFDPPHRAGSGRAGSGEPAGDVLGLRQTAGARIADPGLDFHGFDP